MKNIREITKGHLYIIVIHDKIPIKVLKSLLEFIYVRVREITWRELLSFNFFSRGMAKKQDRKMVRDFAHENKVLTINIGG